ncbi:MAG: delta-lactam-biosynthetic de-N-acetylase [Ruminococcaceae bacterium]|nr:delta-lactam-biosynthetic de-N-acetylase [Oscillospiraceae bacterium]
MKKTVLFFMLLVAIIGTFMLPVQAQAIRHQWYCKHAKEHIQPTLDKGLAFIEEYNAYYIDRQHTDANADQKVIYLTFDAGYENGNVEKTLNILREENVPAAFFILQNLIYKNAELVKRMADEGHLVCNHSAHHKDMSGWKDEDVLVELRELESLYAERIGGEMPKYYRPPEGVFSRENLACVSQNGYKTIFWSFAYPDWNNQKQMTPEKAKGIILDNLHNGEVMLLHPTSDTNVKILAEVIQEARAQGYRFGTLDELTGVDVG